MKITMSNGYNDLITLEVGIFDIYGGGILKFNGEELFNTYDVYDAMSVDLTAMENELCIQEIAIELERMGAISTRDFELDGIDVDTSCEYIDTENQELGDLAAYLYIESGNPDEASELSNLLNRYFEYFYDGLANGIYQECKAEALGILRGYNYAIDE